jgi:hypothetical protein
MATLGAVQVAIALVDPALLSVQTVFGATCLIAGLRGLRHR